MASEQGKASEGDSDGTFRWEKRDARWVYIGLRKLLRCDFLDATPTHGTEITFSQFELSSRENLEKFVAGESVAVLYEE